MAGVNEGRHKIYCRAKHHNTTVGTAGKCEVSVRTSDISSAMVISIPGTYKNGNLGSVVRVPVAALPLLLLVFILLLLCLHFYHMILHSHHRYPRSDTPCACTLGVCTCASLMCTLRTRYVVRVLPFLVPKGSRSYE